MHDTLAAPMASERDVGDAEASLVRAAQADPRLFTPLYQRYADRVYAYLRARTSLPEDAADLTQQAFLQALDALPGYRPGRAPFAAWLFRIARNIAVDHHRRHRQTVTWDYVPEALQPVVEGDLSACLVRAENLAYLRELFVALDRETRELLVLRFAARLTVPEIAAVIGAREGATKMRLIRALRALKEHYHDHAV